MSKRERIHYLVPDAEDGGRMGAACDKPIVGNLASADAGHVTCVRCLRALRRIQLAKEYRERNLK